MWSGLANAQVSVNASGGNGTGSGGTTSYTIGQLVYTAHEGNSGSVAQGVQQAFEIYSVGLQETDFAMNLSVFPNPTTENLIVQVSNWNEQPLSFELTDEAGRLLLSETILSAHTPVNMENMQAATYFIHVLNHAHARVQTFKVIKAL